MQPDRLRRLGRHGRLCTGGGAATIALGLAILAGCGGGGPQPSAGAGSLRVALEHYVTAIEPIRLSVNRLLDRADPILEAFHHHRIRAAEASARMGGLERRFAAFTVDIAAIAPTIPSLRSLHAEYAQTYVFEDAYLSALAAGLAHDDLHRLPNTQAEQRAAIIHWRVGLMVLARAAGAALPADLQQAGRGEIAPSPQGS